MSEILLNPVYWQHHLHQYRKPHTGVLETILTLANQIAKDLAQLGYNLPHDQRKLLNRSTPQWLLKDLLLSNINPSNALYAQALRLCSDTSFLVEHLKDRPHLAAGANPYLDYPTLKTLGIPPHPTHRAFLHFLNEVHPSIKTIALQLIRTPFTPYDYAKEIPLKKSKYESLCKKYLFALHDHDFKPLNTMSEEQLISVFHSTQAIPKGYESWISKLALLDRPAAGQNLYFTLANEFEDGTTDHETIKAFLEVYGYEGYAQNRATPYVNDLWMMNAAKRVNDLKTIHALAYCGIETAAANPYADGDVVREQLIANPHLAKEYQYNFDKLTAKDFAEIASAIPLRKLPLRVFAQSGHKEALKFCIENIHLCDYHTVHALIVSLKGRKIAAISERMLEIYQQLPPLRIYKFVIKDLLRSNGSEVTLNAIKAKYPPTLHGSRSLLALSYRRIYNKIDPQRKQKLCEEVSASYGI